MRPIQLFTLFSIIFHTAALNFMQFTNESHSHLEKCTDEIQRRYTNSEDNIFFINFSDKYRDFRFETPIIIQNELREVKYFQRMHVNFYIIVIPKGYFEQVFSFLVLSKSWNPRAKFLLLFHEEVLKDFLVILRKYFVYNVIFLVEKSDGHVDIMTYYPFKIPSNEFEIVGVCHNGRLRDDQELFPNKLPRDWTNFTVRVILFPYPPFVFVTNDQKRGIEVDLFKMVEYQLGFKVEYLDKPFANWGRKLRNGSYEGAYGYLRRYEVEAAIGLFYANVSAHWDFDQSYPYLEDVTKWVVPAAKRQAQWIGVTKIFRIYIWSCTLISFLLVSLVLRVFGFHLHDMKRQSSELPRHGILRVLMGLWIYFGLMMTAIFQGRLASVLNFAPLEKQIATTSDLQESKLAFGYYKDSAFLYSDKKEKDKFLYYNYVDCPIDLSCLNRTAFKRDFATFKPKKLMEYLISTIYLGKDGRPLVYLFKDNVYKFLITMAFSKGFPILPEVNKVLLHLRIHGFIDFHYKKASYHAERAIRWAQREELSAQVLDMSDIFWAFCLLFFGLAIATFIFVVELFVFKYL
ncbi:hypothetical protein RI129_010127 [Pyrocoelia pectoralis]|uniref:Uncharacterized protein n=1 Tax=Pyrocoelia pectoralis TaxID=417401 RepID=A0AAN7V3S2_9COLE